MRNRNIVVTFVLTVLTALLTAAPSFAGIHYKAKTHTESSAQKQGNGDIVVEAWVANDKAHIDFKDSASPMAKQGSYLLTKDGGRTIYMVDPEEKTYAEWNLQAMLGLVGGIMNGMGPLLKVEFSEPKIEKLVDEDGGTLVGLPTRHYRYRTSYTMKIRVLGMGNEANVVTDQDVWATDKLQDIALGVWLRSDPPHTGNEQFDKLLASQMQHSKGFPLKTVTVSTSTQAKGNKQTVTRSTMEVTELQNATPPASAFEIPAGYKETQLLPENKEDEGQGGLGGLLRRNKKSSGNGDGR
jgi:hypothetical protein